MIKECPMISLSEILKSFFHQLRKGVFYMTLKTNLNCHETEHCKKTSEQEIAALFDRWNQSLQTGDPRKVMENFTADAILLPTYSNKPCLTPKDKESYFYHFLKKGPSGKVDLRHIEIGHNVAVDVGLYTLTFATTGEKVSARYTFTYRWNGSEWLITSLHSSVMPECH